MSNKFERRDCTDRREEEIGPPSGWKDRRRRTERRMPEIGECEVSESEWLEYFGTVDKSSLANDVLPGSEIAAEAFEQTRE